MAVAPTENDACGVGGWTLVMKINGTKVYLFPNSPFRLLNQETDETMDFFFLSVIVTFMMKTQRTQYVIVL